jgi:hypothetical protein
MDVGAVLVVMVSLIVCSGLGGGVLYLMIRSMVVYQDPELTPGEQLIFRKGGAISFDKMLGFANGHVFITNERLVWTPQSFPRRFGTTQVDIPLNLIDSVRIRPREPYRGFAIPVHVMVPKHVYIFYVGFNTLARRNAEEFLTALEAARGQSAGRSEVEQGEIHLPFRRHRNWEYALIPFSILTSAGLFALYKQLDVVNPFILLLLVAGPILTTFVVLVQDVRSRPNSAD